MTKASELSYLVLFLISYFISLFFLAMPCSRWDLGSLTRDGTHASWGGSVVLTPGPPGKSLSDLFWWSLQAIMNKESHFL